MPHKSMDYQDNRKTHTPIFNVPSVIILIVMMCVAAFVVPEYLFSQSLFGAFYTYFAFIPEFFGNAFWRFCYTPITYSFMHGGIMHIAVNMMWLVIFGSPLANRIGAIRFGVFWCVCSIVAALAHFAMYPDSYSPMVGASGAISGLMGAAARYGFRQVSEQGYENRSEFAGPILSVTQSLKSRSVTIFLITWIIIDIITGLAYPSVSGEGSAIAWVAHIGGMVAGFFLIGIFDTRRKKVI